MFCFFHATRKWTVNNDFHKMIKSGSEQIWVRKKKVGIIICIDHVSHLSVRGLKMAMSTKMFFYRFLTEATQNNEWVNQTIEKSKRTVKMWSRVFSWLNSYQHNGYILYNHLNKNNTFLHHKQLSTASSYCYQTYVVAPFFVCLYTKCCQFIAF